MTTQEKRVNRKLSIIEPAEFLKNVSQAGRINGVSRQHFCDINKAYDAHDIEGPIETSRRKPCIKNRVAPGREEAVINMSVVYPAYGQARAGRLMNCETTTSGSFRAGRYAKIRTKGVFRVGYLYPLK